MNDLFDVCLRGPASLVVRVKKIKVGYIKFFFMVGTHRGVLLWSFSSVPLGHFYTNCKMPTLVGNQNLIF